MAGVRNRIGGRQRPLGIAALEDKTVQQAVVTILNQIYEVDFKGFSYGFRPGRGPHQALDALTVGIQRAGTAEAGGSTLVAVPILVVWLYGTLVLAERRSGYIIMLVGSLLASGMPVIHVMGAGGVFRGQIAKSSPAFLFVWTLHALGVTGIFSLILSARGLWSLRRGQPR